MLKSNNLYFLFFARMVSLLGDEVFLLGFPLYIFGKTRSVQQFSMSMFFEITIYVIFSFVGGFVADRWNAKRSMIALDAAMIVSLFIYFVILNRHFSIVSCYILIGLLSALSSIYSIFFEKLPLQILSKSELPDALGYFQSMNQLAKIVGAPLGGLIVYFFGFYGIFFFNAVSFVIPMIVLLCLRWDYNIGINPQNYDLGECKNDIFSGFAQLWKNPFLRRITLLAVFLNIPLTIHAANWPMIYKVKFLTPDKTIGFVQSICAGFFVLVSIFLGRYLKANLRKNTNSLVVAQLSAVVGSLLIYFSPYLYWTVLGSALISMSNACHGLPSTVIRTSVTSVENYGKVLAAAKIVSRILVPLTLAVSVFALNIFSIPTILLISAMICLLGSVLPSLSLMDLAKTKVQVQCT